MKNRIFLLVVCSFLLLQASAQDRSLFKKELFIVKGDTLPYRILLPLNYDPSKKYSLIYFLHGAGERGNDNEAQLTHGSSLFLKDSVREKYQAIVVFPQCPAKSFWSNVEFKQDSTGNRFLNFLEDGAPTIAMDLAEQLLKKIIHDYPVNKKQLYITGLSMGGMGTFELVRRNPGLFAAAMPICGGGAASTASKLTKVKWWVFHGAIDAVVKPEYSQIMVDALKEQNASVKFSLYPGVNHNSWDNAFAEPDLLPWLFAQHK